MSRERIKGMQLLAKYIWLREAVKEYGRSHAWFYKQIEKGVLNGIIAPRDVDVALASCAGVALRSSDNNNTSNVVSRDKRTS